MKKLKKEDYTIAWICALPDPEWKASRLLLDEEHEDADLGHNAQHQYVYGRMGRHNLVMGCLPSTQIGIGAAASLTAAMVATFPNLKYGLLVGIGGGVPGAQHDIRLGDVVVSHPNPVSQDGGVVQYDQGKAIFGGQIQSTGLLNLPPYAILSAISKIRSSPSTHEFEAYLSKLTSFSPFARPTRPDVLLSTILERPQRANDRPVVHYGRIATGNLVIKDASTRDQLSKKHGGVLCFEMEAAGLLNQLPCMVVRGICDYCDEHKNKDWQAYAAATAAAWTRMLLEQMSPTGVVPQTAIPLSRTTRWTVPFARDHDFVGRQVVLDKIEAVLSRRHRHNRIALTGLGGIGYAHECFAIPY